MCDRVMRMSSENPAVFHCIIYQETLCSEIFSFQRKEFTNTAVRSIEFNNLNQNRFQDCVEDVGPEFVGFICQFARGWLSESKAEFFFVIYQRE
jgi:hypothetical protein